MDCKYKCFSACWICRCSFRYYPGLNQQTKSQKPQTLKPTTLSPKPCHTEDGYAAKAKSKAKSAKKHNPASRLGFETSGHFRPRSWQTIFFMPSERDMDGRNLAQVHECHQILLLLFLLGSSRILRDLSPWQSANDNSSGQC